MARQCTGLRPVPWKAARISQLYLSWAQSRLNVLGGPWLAKLMGHRGGTSLRGVRCFGHVCLNSPKLICCVISPVKITQLVTLIPRDGKNNARAVWGPGRARWIRRLWVVETMRQSPGIMSLSLVGWLHRCCSTILVTTCLFISALVACRRCSDTQPTKRRRPRTSLYRPILFCSLAVLDPMVGHTMDVLSPFIPVVCHSD